MNRYSVLILLMLVTLLTLACGSSSRQLQSINIKATTSVGQVQFTASGTFSAPPTTVVPVPVDWANGFLAPPVETLNYTLTTQPYILSCLGSPSGTEVQVTAFAPQNPNAPVSGSSPWAKLVMSHSAIACP
jgi:hypothetical protein